MKATLLLIGLCIVAFAYTVMLADRDSFFDAYGFSGANLIKKPYVLVTSIFLHADLTHLLSNLFVLFVFGAAVEGELKAGRMLALFFVGAFLGDALSLFVYPFDSIAIGASAGIFALVGAGIFVRPLDLSFYPLVVPVPLALLGVLYAAYNIYFFLADPGSQISYVAHLGGLAAGLAVGARKVGMKKSFLIVALSLLALLLIPVLARYVFR